MIQKLEALHLEALCEEVRKCGIPLCAVLEVSLVCVCLQDLQQRVQKHSEVEIVDLVLKLKDKLVSVKAEVVK